MLLLILLLNYFVFTYSATQSKWDKRIKLVFDRIREKNEIYETSKNPEKLPIYDFIVVGSGLSGSTLVAELLEKNPNLKILIIEAGSHLINQSTYFIENSNNLSSTEYNWKDKSSLQTFLKNRTLDVASGRGIGGSSLINSLIWMRGHPNDYNSWAIQVQDGMWGYKTLLPLFKKIENYTGTISKYRGKSGRITVTDELSNTIMTDAFKNAFADLRFHLNADSNGETPYGVSTTQLNVKIIDKAKMKAIRQNSFKVQLNKYLDSKSNLDFLSNAIADKVVLNKNKQVEYLIFLYNGKSYRVRAKMDVIISCGALRTPTVLLRSGIGDCEYLKSKSIECKHNLPGVGKNFQYHMMTPIIWRFKNRFKPNGNILLTLFDSQSNLTTFATPKNLIKVYNVNSSSFRGFKLFYIQLHQRARGSILLQSQNPLDPPIINYNCFSNSQDMSDHLDGVRLAIRIGEAIAKRFPAKLSVLSNKTLRDTNLIQYIKYNVISTGDYGGSCKMDRLLDKNSVVDSKLKVKGIKGLRIADLSIVPTIPSGNTNAAASIIGAKCAEIIFNEYFH